MECTPLCDLDLGGEKQTLTAGFSCVPGSPGK